MLVGDYLNNTGANRTFILRIKFGGTTIYQDTTAAAVTSTSRRQFFMHVWMANQNNTSDQTGGGHVRFGNGPAVIGLGDLGAPTPLGDTGIVFADSAISTTSNQTS